jgi:hypothetical protein
MKFNMTGHAIERWVERGGVLSWFEMDREVEKAELLEEGFWRTPCGLVLVVDEDSRVLTVLTPRMFRHNNRRIRSRANPA